MHTAHAHCASQLLLFELWLPCNGYVAFDGSWCGSFRHCRLYVVRAGMSMSQRREKTENAISTLAAPINITTRFKSWRYGTRKHTITLRLSLGQACALETKMNLWECLSLPMRRKLKFPTRHCQRLHEGHRFHASRRFVTVFFSNNQNDKIIKWNETLTFLLCSIDVRRRNAIQF